MPQTTTAIVFSMNLKNCILLLGAILLAHISPAIAQEPYASNPPVIFSGAIKTLDLPEAPTGMTWKRLEEIDVAVVVPDGWKLHRMDGPFHKLFAFSDQPLDKSGYFQRGLTVKVTWHPQLKSGNEARAVETVMGGVAAGIEKDKPANTTLMGTLEKRNGKSVMIIRYRNGPKGLEPIIVHTMLIGDPKTGLVYQVIFEAPEAEWDENWKVGEQILKRVVVAFQAG